MSAASVISVQGVTKRFRIPLDRSSTLKYRLTHPRSTSRYHDFHALRDVTFDVAPGQFLGIIGHNGSGKSTLLKILSRIYEPTSGTVTIDGYVSPFLELGVGFNPELTARENVFLNGAVLGLTRKELTSRIDEIIAFAEIEEFADQKLKNFSSGMQVRLAFSVAIRADARILLMDEVLAVGDAAFQEKCFEVFARYKREGRTIVLVTHDTGSVDAYCDRVLLLDHGRLIDDGRAADVTSHYRRLVGARGGAQAVGDAVDRWGDGAVEIQSVTLLDANGRPGDTFTTGQPMVIQVDFKAYRQVGDLVVGFGLARSDGLSIAGTDTRLGGIALPCPPAGREGRATYVIDRLPLLDSRYLLTVEVHDKDGSSVHDHRERAYGFRVVDEKSLPGLVDLGGTWTSQTRSAETTARVVQRPA